MDYTGIRKLSLRVFLGFLVLTAVIAVLRGEFGEFQVKTLVTSATISVASICSMSCISFIERKQQASLGLTGVFFCVVAASLSIIAMWGGFDGGITVRIVMSLWVISVAFAHGFLLLLPALDTTGLFHLHRRTGANARLPHMGRFQKRNLLAGSCGRLDRSRTSDPLGSALDEAEKRRR